MRQVTLSYRLAVASRVIAAIIGGYGLATIAILVLTYALPGGKGPGLLMGMVLSFTIYAAAIIWVFAARSAIRAWGGAGCGNCATGIYLFID